MEYVEDNIDTTTGYNLINNNKVMAQFKRIGYKNIALDNWYSVNPAKGEIVADFNFNYAHQTKLSVVDGLSNLVVSQTMLRPFSYLVYQQYGDLDDFHRNSTLFSFGKLAEIVDMAGPKFVYAHILCPHTPFTFDQNGESVNAQNKYNWKDKKYYLDQYKYVNKRITSLVTHILKNSKSPPIIIIQSDHGPRPQFGQDPKLRFNVPDEDTYRIFYTYYLPNQVGQYISGTVDPIDTFGNIFNNYLR